jgi:hypothetical protein
MEQLDEQNRIFRQKAIILSPKVSNQVLLPGGSNSNGPQERQQQ